MAALRTLRLLARSSRQLLQAPVSLQTRPLAAALHLGRPSYAPIVGVGIKYQNTKPRPDPQPILQVLPPGAHSMKVIFTDHQASDFNFLWLRDNCACKECVEPNSKQKLVDTAQLDASIKPSSYSLEEDVLKITWSDGHLSTYNSKWLYKYGQSYLVHEEVEEEFLGVEPPPLELWDRVRIWQHMPEISHREVMSSEGGLRAWLEMLHKFGLAIMRDVPCQEGEIVKVANRLAYVKPTIWGETFDVVCRPVQSDPSHLAYTGRALEMHTDMNYREKSPGLQMLHCLENSSPAGGGGESCFVDGFFMAEWLREYHPAAFHILTSTPVQFSIKSHEMKYKHNIPIICMSEKGDVTEIHYNNRTLAPLRMPQDILLPFYHGYRLLANKMREMSSIMSFQMCPGDLVAFNNRRVLHGRSSFDPTQVTRHLQGCYVDLDEVTTRYRSLLTRS